ncbi:MAG TPA: Nramp family divalent metal transporter [Terriglobales bacterium]|nr:Nramp family divalent metal transporter [Terriglobales bacterium]
MKPVDQLGVSETPAKRKRRGWLPELARNEMWRYFGPAFVASVAYIDPGNFATNIEGGSRFGYTLLWVILWSNLMAMLVQYLSAKLGIATGKSLPQNCRERYTLGMNIVLWLAAEMSAMATDLAEFLGAALGFYLLFHINLFASALITTVLVFVILAIELYGYRRLEQTIMGFVVAIGLCYGLEMFLAKPEWRKVFGSVLVPHIESSSIYIAVGILGATVMPHVIYLHSALVQPRVREHEANCPPGHFLAKLRHAKYELLDVIVAMNGAFLVNSAMLIMAAAVFMRGGANVATIEQAHQTLRPILGPLSAGAFALALLFSGLASSTVGTMAGQVIIEGFLNVKFPVFLRRFLTVLPALIVIGVGVDAMKVLVLSQVVLSFTLPFALLPLIALTRRRDVMTDLVNSRVTNACAYITAGIIISLNILLLYQAFGGEF